MPETEEKELKKKTQPYIFITFSKAMISIYFKNEFTTFTF